MILNFMKSVAAKIVLIVDDKINYGAEIARKADITNGAVVNAFKELEKEDLIKINNKSKRKKTVSLTNKGKELRFHLEGIRDL